MEPFSPYIIKNGSKLLTLVFSVLLVLTIFASYSMWTTSYLVGNYGKKGVQSDSIVNIRSNDWKAFQAFLHSNISSFWSHLASSGQQHPRQLSSPTVYVITPTYPRAEQIAELTRIGQTLMLAENIIWIVAEDALQPTKQVLELLKDLGIVYKYLLTPMPKQHRDKKHSMWPKGVANRNGGLEWILEHVKETKDDSGVIYFCDDDNTYDYRLFNEIRHTKKLSMFPVGFMSERFVSTPILHKNGSFLGFYEGWPGGRQYQVDMAGFAVSVRQFVRKNDVEELRMEYKKGYEEESFLDGIGVPPKEMEFLADNCTKIYVWHTRTTHPNVKETKIDTSSHKNTNLGQLNKYWCLYIGDHPCGQRWKESPVSPDVNAKH